MSQNHYYKNVKITDHKYQFWILKIIALLADRPMLFGQATKQPLDNFELQRPWKYNINLFQDQRW